MLVNVENERTHMDENTPNSNEALIQELALRALANPFDPRVEKPQLLPEMMPSELPFEVPIPEGSRILGSLIRDPENIEIFLDSPLSQLEALDFYKKRLQAAGWQELERS